jgi:hypothetical protein
VKTDDHPEGAIAYYYRPVGGRSWSRPRVLKEVTVNHD